MSSSLTCCSPKVINTFIASIVKTEEYTTRILLWNGPFLYWVHSVMKMNTLSLMSLTGVFKHMKSLNEDLFVLTELPLPNNRPDTPQRLSWCVRPVYTPCRGPASESDLWPLAVFRHPAFHHLPSRSAKRPEAFLHTLLLFCFHQSFSAFFFIVHSQSVGHSQFTSFVYFS